LKFFYADTLDHVDPNFDFIAERYRQGRVVQRDDQYAHEIMAPARPYDGLLVSRYALEGRAQNGRYTQAQRLRFMREGARRFLRYDPQEHETSEDVPILGDCGAFNYRHEENPPYATDEMIQFYETSGFTHGVSIDHMVIGFDTTRERIDKGQIVAHDPEWQRRYELTLHNANEMWTQTARQALNFRPIGVAQGWSPKSYRYAVRDLSLMGYRYIALGGLAVLNTKQILQVLSAVKEEQLSSTFGLHLFGISRPEHLTTFAQAGVISFDTTSPMRHAFKDRRNNYYSDSEAGHYVAVRIPQVDEYNKLINLVRAGTIDRPNTLKLEQSCLKGLRGFDRGEVSLDSVLDRLQSYEQIYGGQSNWPEVRRTLTDQPWKRCPCSICREVGVEVILFRGANRNKRRGFHNMWFLRNMVSHHRSLTSEQ
jgi:hypothetical protein